MCKINRQTAQVQPIYLNSDIYIEMLHALYYLFNNNLQLDAYIAIEAITLKAEEELLADVILVDYIFDLEKKEKFFFTSSNIQRYVMQSRI